MQVAKSRRGFTLVELLVVIAIIGILVALLLPAVQAAREAARRISCTNNLKQIALALHNYHDSFKKFPPEAIWHGNPRGTQSAPGFERNYTWITLIMPYMELSQVHDAIDFRIPALNQMVPGGENGQLQPLQAVQWPNFVCPTDDTVAEPPHGFSVTSYAGSAGWDAHRRKPFDTRRAGVFSLMDSCTIADIKDGTSNTIAVGEVTRGGFCCRPGSSGDRYRWAGNSGSLRQGNSRVYRTLTVAASPWVFNHSWILAAQKGPLLRSDGTTGGLWHTWAAPYLMYPVYYDHYAMGVEWPGAGSAHIAGANFALADGSVRFIPEGISTGSPPGDSLGRNGNIWVAAHTINGSLHNTPEAIVEWPDR